MRRPFRLWGGRALWQTEKKQKTKHKTKRRRDRTYRGKVFQTEESTFGFAAGESRDSRTKPGEDVWKAREEWKGRGGGGGGDGGEDESFVVPMLNELENTIELL